MTIGADRYTFAGLDLFGDTIRTRTVTGQWQTPPLVGGGVKLLNVPGERFLKKIHGARKLSIEILLLTDPTIIDPDTGSPDRITVYNNLDLLSSVLNIQYIENPLVWHHPDGTDRVAMAHGVGFNPADVSKIGDMYIGTADFLMSDPYFYRPAINTDDGGTGALTIINPGTVRSNRIQFTLTNATNPTIITNTTLGMTLELAYPGSSGPYTGFIDCYTWIATLNSVSVIGYLTHSGDTPFMDIIPGENDFTISGADACTMTWYPAFI